MEPREPEGTQPCRSTGCACRLKALRGEMGHRFDVVEFDVAEIKADVAETKREVLEVKLIVGTTKIETGALINAVADINARLGDS